MKKSFITNGLYSLVFGGAMMLLTVGFIAALFFLPRFVNLSSTDAAYAIAMAYAIAPIITIIGIVSLGIALVTVVRVDEAAKKGNSIHSAEFLKRKRLITIGSVIALLLFTVLVVLMISITILI